MENLVKCKACGNEIAKNAKVCPSCGAKNNKPFYKAWWFWVIVVFVVLIIGGSVSGNDDTAESGNNVVQNETVKQNDNPAQTEAVEQRDNFVAEATEAITEENKITVIDFSEMSKSNIEEWISKNGLKCKFSEDYSDTIAKGNVIKQSIKANEKVTKGSTINVVLSKGKKVSIEYQNALSKAQSYSKMMHMSKQGVYDQLTSEYGEKFPADAAQYAIDNLTVDWKENALEKAKTYQQTMNMSKSAIYDQLVSSYGEKFTEEEAQYAIDHLE